MIRRSDLVLAESRAIGHRRRLGTGEDFFRFVLPGFSQNSRRLGTGEDFFRFVLSGYSQNSRRLGTGRLSSSLFSLVVQINVVHSQENGCQCPNAQTEAEIHGVRLQETSLLCPNASTEANIHGVRLQEISFMCPNHHIHLQIKCNIHRNRCIHPSRRSNCAIIDMLKVTPKVSQWTCPPDSKSESESPDLSP